MVAPFSANESRQSVGNFSNRDLIRALYVIKGLHKHPTILRNSPNTFCQDWPGVVDPVIDCT